MYDVTALGELLIDFTPYGKSGSGNILFEANPGGAPCNVLSQLCRLGKKTLFIGKVGNDSFGQMLGVLLGELGVDINGLRYTADTHTTLAFVHLNDVGERSFTFARKRSADVMLSPDEVDPEQIGNSRIFHCGTLSMTEEPSRSATLKALQCAKEQHVLISADPNLRKAIWPDLKQAKKAIYQVLEYANIIKISDNELAFLYNDVDKKTAAYMLYDDYKPEVLFVTCGREGAYLMTRNGFWWHRCYSEVETIDTTGAGDAFLGASLYKLLDIGFDIEQEQAIEILRFASAAAALVTTKKGAILSMPSLSEIESLISGENGI